MKKISLVTYHCSPNVGAVMQTYALCRFLKEHGYQVEIVDIRNFEPNLKTISEGSPLPIRLVKSVIYPKRINNIFKKFYPALTKHYVSMDELRQNPPQSDYYIVGSDQVWNHVIARNKALAYFLDFGSDNVRRLSYASSFGLSQWEAGPYAPTEKVRECLDRFYSLSVRELEGQNILKETFKKDATIVLDPTFLNDSYPEISGKDHEMAYEYVSFQNDPPFRPGDEVIYMVSADIDDYYKLCRGELDSIDVIPAIRTGPMLRERFSVKREDFCLHDSFIYVIYPFVKDFVRPFIKMYEDENTSE